MDQKAPRFSKGLLILFWTLQIIWCAVVVGVGSWFVATYVDGDDGGWYRYRVDSFERDLKLKAG